MNSELLYDFCVSDCREYEMSKVRLPTTGVVLCPDAYLDKTKKSS
jgi:hypothetical protein